MWPSLKCYTNSVLKMCITCRLYIVCSDCVINHIIKTWFLRENECKNWVYQSAIYICGHI